MNAIVRPPRAEYSIEELGPAQFDYAGARFVREDSTLTNPRGLTLHCSFWRRADLAEAAPCVVYTHGNASCRAEALQILAPVLASGASVFSFDFAGCGHSQVCPPQTSPTPRHKPLSLSLSLCPLPRTFAARIIRCPLVGCRATSSHSAGSRRMTCRPPSRT